MGDKPPPHWPSGAEAEPIPPEHGSYITDDDGLIIGVLRNRRMTREEIEREYPGWVAIDLDHHVANGDSK